MDQVEKYGSCEVCGELGTERAMCVVYVACLCREHRNEWVKYVMDHHNARYKALAAAASTEPKNLLAIYRAAKPFYRIAQQWVVKAQSDWQSKPHRIILKEGEGQPE